ncbi:uncharacterized protein VICG_02237, partial [Vittaforma corneae ATCC 50505]
MNYWRLERIETGEYRCVRIRDKNNVLFARRSKRNSKRDSTAVCGQGMDFDRFVEGVEYIPVTLRAVRKYEYIPEDARNIKIVEYVPEPVEIIRRIEHVPEPIKAVNFPKHSHFQEPHSDKAHSK